MSEKSYSSTIRSLSAQYYNRELSTEEYRQRRRHILDLIEIQYNELSEPTQKRRDDDAPEKY